MKYLNNLPRHKYPWLPILYNLVLTLKPKTIIEFGTEHGGTAITMALALKELFELEGHRGMVYTYDTYEDQSKGEIGSCPNYQYALNNIKHYLPDVSEFITMDKGDFFEFNYNGDAHYDLLYFDIDNDGSKLLEMYEKNKSNIEQGAVVVFEGGSYTRDNVNWMIARNKLKMNDTGIPFKLLTPDQKYSCSILYNTNIYQLEL
jgi:predicted O-methyltransferase YrrM